MATELGCLLGAYNGSQSFEQVGSWDLRTTQSSLSTQSTDVHSSALGGKFSVLSGGAGSLAYNYKAAGDLNERWSSDVSTHRVVSTFWAKVTTSQFSGQATAVMSGAGSTLAPIAYTNSLSPYRVETQISSGDAGELIFSVNATANGTLMVDDVLTAVDVITLQPDWASIEQRELYQDGHTTLSGRSITTTWNHHGRWQIPINYVPSSEAALINAWWQNARTLVFTWDSSDTAQTYVVRLGNSTRPITQLQRPYQDLWHGVLQLEAISSGLEF